MAERIPAAGAGVLSTQSWEDPTVLVEALRVQPGDRVLSVCGAGDNCLALVIAGADVVCVAADEGELALCELKLEAARELTLGGYRELLGLGPPGRRVFYFHNVRGRLSPRARQWWDAHEALLRQGVLGAGRFERHLARLRALPWGSPARRGLARIAFSRTALTRWGRAGTDPPEVRRRLCQALEDGAPNFFLGWFLRGRYDDLDDAHPYFSAAGFAKLKSAPSVRFIHGSWRDHLRSTTDRYDALHVSGIVDEDVLRDSLRVVEVGAWVAGWGTASLLAAGLEPADTADLERIDRTLFAGPLRVARVRGAD